MELKKIEKDGVIYWEGYFACPVCFEGGRNDVPVYWKHYECGGQIYIGDNAKFYCEKCETNYSAFRWEFICPCHSNS